MLIKRMDDGVPFDMGPGDTRRVIGPEEGAQHLTFNYARFAPGQAFKQHIHEHSEDLILVLEGGGVIRHNWAEHPIAAGDVILVSPGEYHGTVAGSEGLVCVSVQAPIDPKLYRGGAQPAER